MVNEELTERLNTLTLAFNENSNDVVTCFEIGKVYSKLKNYEEARKFYKKALILKPDEIGLNLSIGLTYSEMGDFDNAIFYYEQILKHNENSEKFLKIKAGAYLNIANINYFKNNFDKSIELLEEALSILPGYLDVYVNLGNCYNYKKDREKAIYYFKKALEFDSNDLDARHNLAYTQLVLGDFKNGLVNYEYRILSPQTPFTTEYLTFEKPRWQGENLDGKTIFVQHEQGFGDAIQFVRFFSELKSQGAKVLYNAPDTFFELFKGSNLICPELVPPEIYKTDKDFESHFDFYIQLMSLPYILNMNPNDIPFSAPYIFPNPKRIEKFQKFFQKDNNKIKIGINWQGNPNGDKKRIIKLKEFYTLCDIPNVSLYSFQKGTGQEELAELPADIKIVDLGQYFNDYSDTAAALTNMDLLISNDSSMAHLGGAMGIKTWILLPYFPEWRWGIQTDKSPWYDCVTLFRQKIIDNWAEVFQEVKEEILNKRVRKNSDFSKKSTFSTPDLRKVKGNNGDG